jgi:zinc transporter ZupT
MNTYLFPIYAVLLGVLIVTLTKNRSQRNTKLLLSFSGAFLLALTLFELLPEVYHHLEGKITGILIMSGIIMQLFLESLSKGAEHGHIHVQKHNNKFPWLLFISLCIHSFLEGFPIHQHNDMVYGVLVHKIPIAMLITGFLLDSKFTKIQITSFLVVFTLMTPLGTIISNNVAGIAEYTEYINAFVIGIFFHIATIILFESSEGHKFNIAKLSTIIVAVVLAYLI